MMLINATTLDRKSGGAQWRDLCVDAFPWECFSTERLWAWATHLKSGGYSLIFDGAYPDFLLRAASDVHVCGSP
jgi:hypothetical protein